MAVLYVNVNTVCNATCNFSSSTSSSTESQCPSPRQGHSNSSVCSKRALSLRK